MKKLGSLIVFFASLIAASAADQTVSEENYIR